VLDLLPREKVARLGVFSSDGHVLGSGLWAELRAEAQRRGFTGTLLAGARSHVTELNRRQEYPGHPGAQGRPLLVRPDLGLNRTGPRSFALVTEWVGVVNPSRPGCIGTS
jgi:hypothetical protein